MKKNLFKITLMAFLSSGFWACEKTKDAEPIETDEYRFIRLLVSDENTNQISLVNPKDLTVESFQAKYPKSALYTTESGRFAGLVHRESNMFETFDTGFEYHGDHVDIKGTPKFGALIGESKLPTHFKSKKGEIMLFNDGDGTLSVGKESDIHTPGMKMKTIDVGIKLHHGAMATFLNGTYAVTEKDGSVPGALPERVRIVDANGKLLHESKIATKGIHGNASDGKYSVFGSASGILVVEANGNQKLIAHPEGFGTAWFGSILETSENGRFIGYTAAKGAYLIDATMDKVTPIVENVDFTQCKVDYAERNLVTLTHSGELSIFDIKTNTRKASAKVIDLVAKDEKQKPQLVATSKYVYISSPKTGEILKIETANLSNVQRIKVSATPYRMTLFGYELSRKGDD